MLAVWCGLCANFTLFAPIFGGDNNTHYYKYLGNKPLRFGRNILLCYLVCILNMYLAGIKMCLTKCV